MELVLELRGEIDHHRAESLRQRLDKEILESGADKVIFDLSHVTFMDSSGIGVLLGRYKLFATRKLYLFGANETVDRLLTMAGVYSVMPKYEENL
ncbi:MAG: anti-sigma factor antagonist [Clostridia bacterium]|nr:anti-sigma factor antagonist [Clostridia bacterium]